MKSILDLLHSDAAADMALALLHTLWQGMIIAVVLLFLLKNTSGRRSELRYRLSVISLCAIVLCWLGTFSILQYETPSPNRPTIAAQAPALPTQHAPPPETAETTVARYSRSSPPAAAPLAAEPQASDRGSVGYAGWAVMLWAAGVFVMLTRMFGALAGAARLKRDAVDIEDPAIVALFARLCEQMNIRRTIRFAASKTFSHPGVIGFFRPVLLIPLSILSEISPDDLQAILAHELAHIRRFDYMVNFCQMVVEAVLFFNPAVWWISRRIRIEREACCDVAGVEAAGQRVRYARILFEQIAGTASPYSAAAAAVTGFSEDNAAVSEERIRRIVCPQHKPRMKVGAIKLVCWLLVSGAALVGLTKTTDMAIAMAAKMLTPAERIEMMAELEKSHGQPAFDLGGYREVTEEDKVTLAGTVRTWDGEKVKPRAHMTIRYSRHQDSGSIGISPTFGDTARTWKWDGDTGLFAIRDSYGVIYVSVSAPGYAPACVGPFQLEPGQVKDDIEIVLEKGYPASIQIVDMETQQPVANVELVGGYLFRPGGYSYTIKLMTNENGVAVIEDAGDFNVTLQARAAGYQQTTFVDRVLLKNETLVLEMKKAEAAEGTVVSKRTGQPIPDAVIRIQQTTGKNQTSWGRDQSEILATTDDSGHFVINQLDEATTYVLSVKADGYAYAFTDEIGPGQKDVQVQLHDEIVISGKVVGPLDKLPVREGMPYVSYAGVFRWNSRSHVELSQQAFVTIEGDEGFFEVTGVWGTHVNIGSDHWKKTIKFDEPIPDEIVLDMSDPLTEDGKPYHKRQVVLEFNTPEGFPPPTGSIRLNYIDPYAGNAYRGKLIDIIDGKAEGEIVAPGKIAYKIANTVGYWFEEVNGLIVDDGTEPLVIRVPTIPAGMIFGQVYEEDGAPAGNTLVSCRVVKTSPLIDKEMRFSTLDLGKNSSSSSELETKYTAAPLPLEGVYRLVARRKYTYVVSEPIALTEDYPIQEVDLVFPEGVLVTVQVLSPDGSPLVGIECCLNFKVTGNHSFGAQSQYTDSQGHVAFDRVNPDADGSYTLSIKTKKDYRPVRMELPNLNSSIEIILEQGAVASGQIIDTDTGWPIPGVEVTAYYHNYQDGNSESERIDAEGKTDSHGQFRFSTMKPDREYNLIVTDCRQTGQSATISAGQTNKVIPVSLYEWSTVKPRRPDGD